MLDAKVVIQVDAERGMLSRKLERVPLT